MHALVTGGAGFIGSHLVGRLLSGGARVRVFDRVSGAPASLGAYAGEIEVIAGDLRDAAAVERATTGIDVVFHLGAEASVPRSLSDPRTTHEVNVGGTLNVLLAARAAGCRRVVFASTCAVYGATATPLAETAPPVPASPYAWSKLAGEELCALFTRAYGLETVSLRYFNVFGPGQNPTAADGPVVARFIAALRRGEPVVIHGDGEQTRDFVFVENVVAATLLAATVPGVGGEVFNVASGVSISLNALLALLAEVTGVVPRVEHTPPRPGDLRHSAAEIAKAVARLGYTVEVPLPQGLARTVAAQT